MVDKTSPSGGAKRRWNVEVQADAPSVWFVEAAGLPKDAALGMAEDYREMGFNARAREASA